MKKEIQELREKLYELMAVESFESDKILRVSEELDQLILKYYTQGSPEEPHRKP